LGNVPVWIGLVVAWLLLGQYERHQRKDAAAKSEVFHDFMLEL
jgi:hypothetical protein